jgi:eukaryotic-like serine/threonine-protein kinase
MQDTAVSSAALCLACGERLGASGACIACLVRVALDDGEASAAGDSELTFGDFEIERRDDGTLSELGRGAAGVTYRATDKVLRRPVALKVIEPAPRTNDGRAVRERFLREARAAAALRHPNIAAVFQFGASGESGRCYCAMELVEGETLEARVRRTGPISVDVALEIGIEVCGALIAAAERGLVHRDLKPGNIMLARRDDDGGVNVKVIDFGLAKAISSAEQMELTCGGFVGTPAFASPEQFEGGAIDARSDIYALGVTLWFALTGRLPSAGTTIEEIRHRQAERQLPLEQLHARGVPPPLIDLLRSCLEVDPGDRPVSARELLRAFEACRLRIARARRSKLVAYLAVAAAVVLLSTVVAVVALRSNQSPAATSRATADRPIEKGVAVLPFENLTAEKADAFLSDGIQDDLRTTLAKIKDLKVIARGSVQDYRGARGAPNAREIGRTLGVSHVVHGSVRRAGDRVVVHAALIDTQEEREVWAERYERSLSDALSLQGQLSLEIARALEAKLRPADTRLATVSPTDNPDAYLLYLRGREAELDAQAKPKEAVEFYEQAIQLDPAFALARARLGIVASELAHMEGGNPTWAEKARLQTAEAMRLQPELGEAHLALTSYHLMVERDYDRALAALNRTTELLPNSAEVALTAAFIYKLKFRYRDRIAALRRAEALDPRNTRVHLVLARTLRWVRDWPEAIRALDRAALPKRDVPLAARVGWTRANDEFRLTGDLNVLKNALAREAAATPPLDAACIARSQFEIAMFERDFESAGRWLADIPAELGHDAAHPNISPHTAAFHRALLLAARGGDEVETRAALESAAHELETMMARPPPAHIRLTSLHADLGIIKAFLGRKEEAIASAQRAIDTENGVPPTIEKNNRSAGLALVYARTGEPEKALDLIEHLLTVPCEVQSGEIYNMTLTDLKWRWVWDPLRDHPRFQKLLAGPEPKTVY